MRPESRSGETARAARAAARRGGVRPLQAVGQPVHQRGPPFVVEFPPDGQLGQAPEVVPGAGRDRHRREMPDGVEEPGRALRPAPAPGVAEQLLENPGVVLLDRGKHRIARPVVVRVLAQNPLQCSARAAAVHTAERQHGLHADARVEIADQLRDQVGGAPVVRKVPGQHRGVLAHAARPEVDGAAQVEHGQRAQPP